MRDFSHSDPHRPDRPGQDRNLGTLGNLGDGLRLAVTAVSDSCLTRYAAAATVIAPPLNRRRGHQNRVAVFA